MALGPRGTAIWIDSHTEDYFARGDRGQRLAGSFTAAVGRVDEDASRVSVESTIESSVFSVCEDDTWTRVAVDEEEGRIAVGGIDGTIMILEYA